MSSIAVGSLSVEKIAFRPWEYFAQNADRIYQWRPFTLVISPLGQDYLILPRGIAGVTSNVFQSGASSENVINDYLGGEDNARSHAFTLDQIAKMLDLQLNGERGELSNNDCVNLFYAKIGLKFFWLSVIWSDLYKNWQINASPITESSEIVFTYRCNRVFCNNILTA